jgi:hypothetical protein
MTPSKKPKPARREVSVINVPDARPDDGLFNPFKEAKAAENATATQPIPTQPNPSQPNPIAATKDFNRRHNSLDRDALPAGLFPGTSQKLYNALFLKTRGAIVPRRTVQATKRELMAWSNIRSKNTIAVNLNILTSIGWIKAEHDIGSHEGSVYEVFTFEELPDPTQPNLSQPVPTQKLGVDPTQKLGWDGSGNPVDNKGTSETPKTSFNTKEKSIDDEAAPRALREVERELTGKNSSTAQWDELWELLTAELKIAAARTTVSSVPAFLTEHLRRRLWKLDKKAMDTQSREAGETPATQPASHPSNCVCGSSLWWYPNGQDKGVARCTEVKIVEDSEGA